MLAVPDFLTTLATEAAIHHLDMTVHLPATPAPDPDALAAAVDTLDGLARTADAGTVNEARTGRPLDWSAETYVLKATGRIPLTADEVAAAMGYPLLS